MNLRKVRKVTVGTSATNIREADARPVAFSIFRYATGGGNVGVSPDVAATYATAKPFDGGADYVELGQNLNLYLVADTGTVDVFVADYEA